MMAAVERDWFDVIVGFSGALNALVLLALTIVLVPAIWSFAQSLKHLHALLDQVHDDIRPLTRHANRIAASVDDITETVRAEVQGVAKTIGQANQGLNRAVESTDKRMREVGALLDVAQQEAERAFVSTAAAVHGVRAGASAALRRDQRPPDAAKDTPARPARPARPRVRARRKPAE